MNRPVRPAPVHPKLGRNPRQPGGHQNDPEGADLAWPILSRIGFGRVPGDIMFQRGGATFYFPLVTCIIISIVLSALFWLFNP